MNKGTETASFFDLLHRLPEKDLTIKQATQTIFFHLYHIYTETPMAVYNGLPGWQKDTKACFNFLRDFATQ
jgi:hypothetical protein